MENVTVEPPHGWTTSDESAAWIDEGDEDLLYDSELEDLDYDESDDDVASDPCCVCLRMRQSTVYRPCCRLPLCHDCRVTYLESKVHEGVVVIQCPGSHCRYRFREYEIFSIVSDDVRHKLHKFLIDAMNDPTLKTCPRCGQELRVEEGEAGVKLQKEVREGGYPVTCQTCALRWCFDCHAPWHDKVTCQDYIRGDRKFRTWASWRGSDDSINAQKCPCCQTYIQRSEGCDSMVCSRCGSNFCYQCGHQYSGAIKGRNSFIRCFFMGDHKQKWSPLGCSGLLWPRFPYRRKVIKSGVFGAKVLGAVVLPPVLLILGLALLLIAAGPVFVGLKVYPRVPPLRQRCTKAIQFFLAVPSLIGYRNFVLLCLIVVAVVTIVCLVMYWMCVLLYWSVVSLLNLIL
ncbi:hypothetical protein ACOMHN_014461 [Nucella lapillus]